MSVGFFFSSRRRHTRYWRDWSSDVCSSDLAARTITVRRGDLEQRFEWDHLVLTPGSITRQFEIPGVPEHARDLKTLVEAVYLRDHLLEQLDLADAQPDTAAGRAARAPMLTVVAVGAGYTGTEFVRSEEHTSELQSRQYIVCRLLLEKKIR